MADPIDAFEQILTTDLAARRLDAHTSAVELSGGMDSTMAALTLADLLGPVRTAALELEGEAGVQQMRRRAQIRQYAGLGPDTVAVVAEARPFHADGRRAAGRRTNPLDGTYAEALSYLYEALYQEGVRVVVTGLGGDELMFQRPEERAETGDVWPQAPTCDFLGPNAEKSRPHLDEELAPASVLHASTLISTTSHAATAMRHGLWPVHPLANPRLLRLCESLPLAWRRRKRLMRERLVCHRYPHEVAYPTLRENFATTCETAMRTDGLRILTESLPASVLADQGLIDPATLAHRIDQVQRSGAASDLYTVLMLEASLRTLLGHER